jgi:NADH-quinone oxidoreductase subunit A
MVFDSLHLAIIVFLVAALVFAISPLIMAAFIAPRTKGGDYRMPFECGNHPFGRSWDHYGLNFYIYALVFIAFDVDVLYLFPIGTIYRSVQGMLPVAEVSFFLFFVLLAVIYFIAKGVFSWPRRIEL